MRVYGLILVIAGLVGVVCAGAQRPRRWFIIAELVTKTDKAVNRLVLHHGMVVFPRIVYK